MPALARRLRTRSPILLGATHSRTVSQSHIWRHVATRSALAARWPSSNRRLSDGRIDAPRTLRRAADCCDHHAHVSTGLATAREPPRVLVAARSCAAVVVLDVSEEVLAARLVERGKTSHRTDDTPEAIQRRFKTFRLQAEPMLEVLTERGVVHSIDASQPADDVFAKACAVYDQVASG
jgi:hypothetical protein